MRPPLLLPAFLLQPVVQLLALLACLSVSLGAQAAFTGSTEISAAAEQFLQEQTEAYLADLGYQARYQVNINRLDSRLRLAACEQPLQTNLENNAQPLGRVTLRVRCEGRAPWSIFVPARVNIYRHVVVSTRPLQRHTLLQAADLGLAEQDIGSLTQGYLLDPAEALGTQLVRGLAAGQPILPSQLKRPPTIRRGERVVISAKLGQVMVRMEGEALTDGSLSQQIRVRNTRSQRIVMARVIGPGQVEVDL